MKAHMTLFGYILFVRRSQNQTLIKCPKKKMYEAFAISDKGKDQMTVFGYVRCTWRTSHIDDHLFFPDYLIRTMGGYYMNEEMHLFDAQDSRDHWKINVFDLLS